jgi:hypothetical protein
MARRWVQGVVGLSIVAVLAACGVPRLSRHWTDAHAARAFWAYGGAGQAFLVEVRNPPPSVTPEALAAAFPPPPLVAPPARYTAVVAEASRPEYRFVLLFGAPVQADGADACAGDVPALSGGAVLQAAFCYRDRVLSEVRGDALGDSFAAGAGSAEARQVLYGVVRHLVPPPEFESDFCRDPDC